MKKIKFLFLVNLIVKISIGLICVVLALFLFVAVHSTISPRYYDKIILNTMGDFIYSPQAPVPLNSYAEYKEGKNSNIYFSKITFTSKISYVFSRLFKLTIVLLILLEFQKILLSIKKYSSFFVNNSSYFKWIGIYLFIFLAYNLISEIIGGDVSMNFPDGGIRHITHFYNLNDYIPIILFLTMAFIASVIFKEGERLRIDNELTV